MGDEPVERIKALSREGKFCNFCQFWDDNPYFSLCYVLYQGGIKGEGALTPLTPPWP